MDSNLTIGNSRSELAQSMTKQAGVSAETVKRTVTSTEKMQQAERSGEEFTISDKQLIQAIEKAIQSMQGEETHLQFSVHEATKQIMVKVVSSNDNEVIREIPPEHSLDFLAKIWERAGLIMDERR